MSNKIRVPLAHENQPVNVPTMETSGAAALDLRALERTSVAIGSHALIKTGLKMAIPKGFVGMICSRSGLALKNGVFVLNAPGVIDSDYRGEIGVVLANFGTERFFIEPGDRIAQMMFVPYVEPEFVISSELDETDRGQGGFGSTGVSA